MSDLIIRPCTLADFPQVRPLLGQLWAVKDVTDPAMRAVFEQVLPQRAYFCAEREGRIVGFGGLSFSQKLVFSGPVAYVEELVVDESCRGQGIGRRMMDTFRTAAAERGCEWFELDSALHRKEAHRFYETYGMEKRCYLYVMRTRD